MIYYKDRAHSIWLTISISGHHEPRHSRDLALHCLRLRGLHLRAWGSAPYISTSEGLSWMHGPMRNNKKKSAIGLNSMPTYRSEHIITIKNWSWQGFESLSTKQTNLFERTNFVFQNAWCVCTRVIRQFPSYCHLQSPIGRAWFSQNIVLLLLQLISYIGVESKQHVIVTQNENWYQSVIETALKFVIRKFTLLIKKQYFWNTSRNGLMKICKEIKSESFNV